MISGLLALTVALASRLPASQVWSMGQATQVMSPTVVTTWYTQHQNDGSDDLLLVVLWRGRPAWWHAAGGVRGGDGTDWIQYGNVGLTLAYDRVADKVRINDQEIALGGDNVVYVDQVDAPTSPKIVRTSRLNSRMPGTFAQIGLALRESREIMNYLQCDAKSGNPVLDQQLSLSTMCLTNLGRQ